MKQLHGSSFIFGTAASVLLATQPVWAQATTKITEVKLSQADGGGVNLVLNTSDGSRPQVFTTKRGNSLVADIINTQLRLPQGNSFRQDNPSDGIASVSIDQLDANSVRVVVKGINNPPESKPVMRQQNGLTFALMPSMTGSGGAAGLPPLENNQIAQSAPAVPNPEVNMEGALAPPADPGASMNQAPPFLPRAVAPPVGDIAISNTDASASVIDLGTQQRVPRLVLRDAPVREVLSLLARAANLNLAFAGGQAGEQAPNTGTGGGDGPTISLDIENEPVQDVFNYVLRLSGLEANRSGRTIFVGANLPNSTRDTVMRNMRLNQVSVDVALNFLVGLGAETAVSRERQVTNVNAVAVGEGINPITETQTTTETQIETQRVDFEDSNPILRGLQALGDERTNSITLIGDPKKIQIAMAQLTQLDIRRRQVAVNVKIVDVNLNKTKDINTSFSFGIDDASFNVSGGVLNFDFRNGTSSATSNDFTTSLRAQVTNGNAKILTDPTLIVQEGQEARVDLTQEVVGQITTTFTDTDSVTRETREVEKEKVGLTVGVKIERIDDNGFVSLSVSPSVKAPVAEVDTGDDSFATLISERSLQSGLVRMRDGQTLILSGIIQESDRVGVSKTPILGDIPIIGSLFRRTQKDNERNEVIVLLTPQILDDSQNSSYGYNYKPSPDVRRMLQRRGLKLPRR